MLNHLLGEVVELDEKLRKFDPVDQNGFIWNSKEILFKPFLECRAMHLLNQTGIL